MADSLLHITLANKIANHSQLPNALAQQIEDLNDDYRMGSILFDLPYYDQLLLTGIHTLQKKPMSYHAFGQTIHELNGASICISLLKNATSPPQFALVYGALTHFAVDIVFHKEIETQIATLNKSHDELEREIGLHCHYDILGHSGVGTPYAQSTTFLFPEHQWSRFVSQTFSALHPSCPKEATFVKWQRSFRAFGLLYSRPFFPWLKTLPPDNPKLTQRSLELVEESIDTALPFLIGAHRYATGQMSITDFSTTLPPLRMNDGLPIGTAVRNL